MLKGITHTHTVADSTKAVVLMKSKQGNPSSKTKVRKLILSLILVLHQATNERGVCAYTCLQPVIVF